MTRERNNIKAERRNVEIQGRFKFNKSLNLSWTLFSFFCRLLSSVVAIKEGEKEEMRDKTRKKETTEGEEEKGGREATG